MFCTGEGVVIGATVEFWFGVWVVVGNETPVVLAGESSPDPPAGHWKPGIPFAPVGAAICVSRALVGLLVLEARCVRVIWKLTDGTPGEVSLLGSCVAGTVAVAEGACDMKSVVGVEAMISEADEMATGVDVVAKTGGISTEKLLLAVGIGRGSERPVL